MLVEADLICDQAAVMANHSDRTLERGFLVGFLSGVAARSYRTLLGLLNHSLREARNRHMSD